MVVASRGDGVVPCVDAGGVGGVDDGVRWGGRERVGEDEVFAEGEVKSRFNIGTNEAKHEHADEEKREREDHAEKREARHLLTERRGKEKRRVVFIEDVLYIFLISD